MEPPTFAEFSRHVFARYSKVGGRPTDDGWVHYCTLCWYAASPLWLQYLDMLESFWDAQIELAGNVIRGAE